MSIVVVDAGHGGNDPGAKAGGVIEKHLALCYALMLGGELCRLNVPCAYTRTTDLMPGGGTTAEGLLHRVRFANEFDARAFISVHFNAGDVLSASGVQIFHAAAAVGGKKLAIAIQQILGGSIHPDGSGWTGGRGLAVLRRTKMPAVLIEYGFLTNPTERERLVHVEHARTLIAQTARGVTTWLRTIEA